MNLHPRPDTGVVRLWRGARLRGLPLVVVVVTGLAVGYPIYYIFGGMFTDNASPLRQAARSAEFWSELRWTLLLTVGAVAVAVVIGTAMAWFAQGLPPGRRWLGALPLFPLVMPPLAMITGYVFLLSPNVGYVNTALRHIPGLDRLDSGPFDVYSFTWMVILEGLTLAAFVFLFVRGSIAGLRQELVDAATTSARPARVFWRIVLPIILPGILYGMLTVTLLALGQFAIPLLLGGQAGIRVLTTGMFFQTSTFPANYSLAAAYGLPILLFSLFVLAVERLVLRDGDRYVTIGGRSSDSASRKGSRAGQATLVGYAVLAVALPLAALGVVAFSPFWSRSIPFGRFTLENFRTVFETDTLRNAIEHSVVFSVITVLITIPVGFLCARTIRDRQRLGLTSVLQNVVISAPLGVPGVVLGAGFLFAYTVAPVQLYGTSGGLILAYSVIVLPFATRMQLVGMAAQGEQLGEAAAVSGAGALRRALRIELPLLRPALGGAAAIVLVLTSQEFAASVLLRSQDTQVMGTVLYDLFTTGSYPQTAVMALLMCVLTAAAVALALLVGGRRAFGGQRR